MPLTWAYFTTISPCDDMEKKVSVMTWKKKFKFPCKEMEK